MKHPPYIANAAKLRRAAEARLRKRRQSPPTRTPVPKSKASLLRLLNELQIYEIELEMQNAELQVARNRLELLLEKYTDLYDFAPVGYFSLDDQGKILEANLAGADLLGMERARLINTPLQRFLVPAGQAGFLAFLKRVFAGPVKQLFEAEMSKRDSKNFWATFHGISILSMNDPRQWCRVAISDTTLLKQAEEAQRSIEALAVANRRLNREIAQRKAAEESLKKIERHYKLLLARSSQMWKKLHPVSDPTRPAPSNAV